MGGAQSLTCPKPLENPDLLSVVTLSDSAVQRLPLQVDDNPLEKEQRNKNIDDFWRDRLLCIESAFDESKKMTEKEFLRLEFAIKKMAPGKGKISCPRPVEDVATCYLINSSEPLKCGGMSRKLQLCMDTLMQEAAKKRYLEELRRAKKKC